MADRRRRRFLHLLWCLIAFWRPQGLFWGAWGDNRTVFIGWLLLVKNGVVLPLLIEIKSKIRIIKIKNKIRIDIY